MTDGMQHPWQDPTLAPLERLAAHPFVDRVNQVDGGGGMLIVSATLNCCGGTESVTEFWSDEDSIAERVIRAVGAHRCVIEVDAKPAGDA